MVELADTSDLGSGAARRKSSSLFIRTNSTGNKHFLEKEHEGYRRKIKGFSQKI